MTKVVALCQLGPQGKLHLSAHIQMDQVECSNVYLMLSFLAILYVQCYKQKHILQLLEFYLKQSSFFVP